MFPFVKLDSRNMDQEYAVADSGRGGGGGGGAQTGARPPLNFDQQCF